MNIYFKFVFILFISCLFSTILYAVSWPYFSESSNVILKSISSASLLYILVLKTVELLFYFKTKHVYDTVFLIFIARIPWMYICCLLFSSPLWILLLLVAADIYILSLPFYLLSYHQHNSLTNKKVKKNPSRFNQDRVLTILLSLLVSSIYSIVIYIVSKLILVPLSLFYFNTQLLIAPIPLPVLIFFFFPLGFSIQKIVLSFGSLKAFLYITFATTWVTITYFFSFIEDVTLDAVLVSLTTFWLANLISLFAMVLCFKS
ncbi:uncharacterized protein T551_00292 [Pneumocystis jirovecii RU7]|uniref:Uncharacterized protein n=1 Tax=Pneumocystis jirovecii (strain RU7) TaxID=1408657 RepID=A0A0W4ZWR7_PNEJ7|nr:uncharacterized protein T551_00292 [Pneumocystis jirovecii RU7]KTW32807.1 hypothetical protein T551_00292 [Pneumocystis jirovecii RU7]